MPELSGDSAACLARLYAAAFGARPSEFTFVFVGDLPPDDVLVPLLEQYLGGGPIDNEENPPAVAKL